MSTSGESLASVIICLFRLLTHSSIVFNSVRIDVDQLIADREAERAEAQAKAAAPAVDLAAPPVEEEKPKPPKIRRKRKAEDSEAAPIAKKLKIRIGKPESSSTAASATPEHASSSKPKVTLKLGPPRAPEPEESFPCCLCVSQRTDGLLRVVTPPPGKRDGVNGSQPWMAHEECASCRHW